MGFRSPEYDEPGAEYQPVDRFAELKKKLLTEGEKPLVPADIAGMEEEFREVMEAREFRFNVFASEQSGGGKNYDVQRENLLRVVGEETVAKLEEWGEKLLEAAGRKTRDHSTGRTGIVVAQVALDLYRFAAKLRTQDREHNTDHQRAVETIDKTNKRIENWRVDSGNPSGCSGEIMARVVDWMLTGEMTTPEN